MLLTILFKFFINLVLYLMGTAELATQTVAQVSIFSVLFYGISKGADKENLFTDQKLLSLVIISFLLITLMCDIVGRNLMLVTLRV